MGHSGEQMLSWLFRRHSEVFLTEHQFEHVETALEEAGIRQRSPRGNEAVAFADLSGYTRLTEEAGDDVAVRVSLTLAQLVNATAFSSTSGTRATRSGPHSRSSRARARGGCRPPTSE